MARLLGNSEAMVEKVYGKHSLDYQWQPMGDASGKREAVVTVHPTSGATHEMMALSILALIHEPQEKRNAVHDAMEALELVTADGLTYSSEWGAERALHSIKKRCCMK